MRDKALDVSNNNGYPYWPSIAAQAFTVGIAKVSQGTTFRDNVFAYNYAQIRRVGLHRGGYCFADPTCDPTQEAQLYVNIVQANGGFEVRPILDLEVTGKSDAELIAHARMWGYEVMRLTGLRPILYSYSSFIQEHGLHVLADQFDLWLADYTIGPPDLGGWPREPLVWQYSDSGYVRGISGAVDFDWLLDLNAILVPQKVVLLRIGSIGEAVKQLQTELNRILHTDIAEDGIYGPITAATVRAFECMYHLTIDGIAGPQVEGKINQILKGVA